MQSSLFIESKNLLAQTNPVLAQTYEQEFLNQCEDTPAQVSEYWCNKIYNLEMESKDLNFVHHRAYLREAWVDPFFWLNYFKEKIIPLFINLRLA